MLLSFSTVHVYLFSQVALAIPSDSNLFLDDHEHSSFNSVEGFPLLDLDFVASSDESPLSSSTLYLDNDTKYESQSPSLLIPHWTLTTATPSATNLQCPSTQKTSFTPRSPQQQPHNKSPSPTQPRTTTQQTPMMNASWICPCDGHAIGSANETPNADRNPAASASPNWRPLST